jgi:hypothetical protein
MTFVTTRTGLILGISAEIVYVSELPIYRFFRPTLIGEKEESDKAAC